MLKRLGERLGLEDGTATSIGVEEIASSPRDTTCTGHLDEFRLEDGLPVWRFAVGGFVLEKRLVLPHLQNTVYVTYRLLSGPGRLRLILRPAVHFRAHDAPVDIPHPGPYRLTAWEDRYELAAGARLPAAPDDAPRPGRGVHARRRADDRDPLRGRGQPGLRVDRRPLEPRLLPGRPDGRGPGHAGRLDRVVGDAVARCGPTRRCGPSAVDAPG